MDPSFSHVKQQFKDTRASILRPWFTLVEIASVQIVTSNKVMSRVLSHEDLQNISISTKISKSLSVDDSIVKVYETKNN